MTKFLQLIQNKIEFWQVKCYSSGTAYHQDKNKDFSVTTVLFDTKLKNSLLDRFYAIFLEFRIALVLLPSILGRPRDVVKYLLIFREVGEGGANSSPFFQFKNFYKKWNLYSLLCGSFRRTFHYLSNPIKSTGIKYNVARKINQNPERLQIIIFYKCGANPSSLRGIYVNR